LSTAVQVSAGSPSVSTGHILSLDSYRFLAASMIVVLHYDSDFVLGLSKYLPTLRKLDLFVDFFFILSGFVIARSYASKVSSWPLYFQFLQKRFARIYPLHLLTLGLVVLMVVIAAAGNIRINHPEVYEWKGLLPTIFLVQAWGTLDHNTFNLPAWSISAEQFVYLLFPIFVLMSRRLPLFVNGVCIVVFIVAFQYSGLLPGGAHWTNVNSDFGNLRAVPTFFAGILLAQLLDRSPPRIWLGWGAIHGLFVACVAAILIGLPDELVLIGFGVILFCAACAELAGAPTFLATPTFALLGNASFAIYLLHRILDIPVVFLLRKIGLYGTAAAPFFAVATYGLCVLLALLCYRYFETPSRRYISNLNLSRHPARAAD